jgi:hypothetical protein
MAIKYIDLKKDELSDEDKLFYSPMRNKEILLVCEKGDILSVLVQSYLQTKYPDYSIYSAGYNTNGGLIPDFVHNGLKMLNLKDIKDVTSDIKDYKDKTFKHIILLNEDEANILKRDIKPSLNEITNLILDIPSNEEEMKIVFTKIEEFFKEQMNIDN